MIMPDTAIFPLIWGADMFIVRFASLYLGIMAGWPRNTETNTFSTKQIERKSIIKANSSQIPLGSLLAVLL